MSLGINTYYVLSNVPPDGRWLFQLLLTSLFVALYLTLIYLIKNKKFEKFNRQILIYIILNSLVFVFFAKNIEILFQYNNFFYIKYVAFAPYLIVLGVGVIMLAPIMSVITKNDK